MRVSLRLAIAVVLALAPAGCFMVGPDYHRPDAPVADAWLPRTDAGIAPDSEPIGPWWETFGDPVLTELVIQAWRQNPSLQAAGVRVLEAQARRGIAIGTIFPQTQNATGSYSRSITSENAPLPVSPRSFNELALGFDVAWEVDLWGKFRRGIESADAEVLAAVADYDDVLISLLAEVSLNYIGIRTAGERLDAAQYNARLQRQSYDIARRRADEGAVSELDPAQAATLLYNTEADIPRFQAQMEAQAATLSILLGVPPRQIDDLLGPQPMPVPSPPAEIGLGIPADLLRRRPDVRRSERLLAAQSAQIGVAKADLFPHLSLVGTINLDAENAKDFFEGRSVAGFGGPQLSWAILNYGRISNNVRVQDARFQAQVGDYTNTVLAAQADVEAALATYLGSVRRTASLVKSVAAAQKAVDIVGLQYDEGAIDFTSVLVVQDFLVQQQDLLAASRGEVAANLVSLYKNLGGGWEPWNGSFVSAETAEAMQSRTRWGDLVTEQKQAQGIEAAADGTEQDRGWWRWRWWWPQW